MCQVDYTGVTKGGENDDWVARALMQVFDAPWAAVHRHSFLYPNARLASTTRVDRLGIALL